MATLSNVVCLVIHRNVIHRFIVQALQDPPLCSSTILSTSKHRKTPVAAKKLLRNLHFRLLSLKSMMKIVSGGISLSVCYLVEAFRKFTL